jgi:hypothetical protein
MFLEGPGNLDHVLCWGLWVGIEQMVKVLDMLQRMGYDDGFALLQVF